ncbi:MAG TPA: hypothetical protein VFZ77_10830 [Acidimicrobiales bacterium]
MSAAAERATDRGRRADLIRDPRVRQWVVLLAPVAVVVVMAWERRWMADDGFIHLRVVDQLSHGNGPVFNAGERVEASTSPLWVGLLTLLSFLTGLGLPWKAVGAGIVLTAIGMVAAQRAALALSRAAGVTGVVWPVGTVAVAALPPFWDYATSGLETGLAFAWIGASCWWLAVRSTCDPPRSRRADLAGAVLVSLGATIRPDFGIYSVAFGAVLVAAVWRRPRAERTALVAALVAVPAAYQVFRMGYYGMLVPNTAIAKEAATAQWASGWAYLADLVVPYALWLPLAAAVGVIALQSRTDQARGARLAVAARFAPPVAAAVHALYITRVGGDFMHARLLLPAVFAVLAPVGVALRLTDPDTARSAPWLRAAAAATAVWALPAMLLLRPTLTPGSLFTTGDTIEDERRLYQMFTGMENPIRSDEQALWVARRQGDLPVEGRLVGVAGEEARFERIVVPLDPDHPAAAAGWFTPPAYTWGPDVYFVQLGVLAHPVGSHLDGLTGDRMGHQKTLDLVWQLAGMTDVAVVRGHDGQVVVSRSAMAAAERAIACGQLGDYLDGIRKPLTPTRFLGNMADSVANTVMRIPHDPHAAEEAFCPGDHDA